MTVDSICNSCDVWFSHRFTYYFVATDIYTLLNIHCVENHPFWLAMASLKCFYFGVSVGWFGGWMINSRLEANKSQLRDWWGLPNQREEFYFVIIKY